MPNKNFSSLISCYRSSVMCKKTHFKVKNTKLNLACLEVLREDGFISAYHILNYKYVKVYSSSFDVISTYNRIVTYSTPKRVYYATTKRLVKLYAESGYYVLSTPFGVMNDSSARKLKTGGILLFAIF